MEKNRSNNRSDNRSDNREDKDLQGYPHYPSKEDITNPENGFRKITADEELANSRRLSSQSLDERNQSGDNRQSEEEDDLGIVSGTEADVTEEDLTLLGDRDEDQDMGDDEMTRNARVDELEEEQDLDIPGAKMNDDEALGQEDEENNYYSLGGDRHENLEEDSSDNKE